MNYKQIRNTLEQVADENNEDLTKLLIRFEKKISMIKLHWISYTRNICKIIV